MVDLFLIIGVFFIMSYTAEEHEQLILWNVPIWINLFNLKLRICVHNTSWHVLYKTNTDISYISAILSTAFPLALCAMECVPRILKERADIGVSKKILNYWWETKTVQQACKSEFIVISVSGRGMVCKISNNYHHQAENKLSSSISLLCTYTRYLLVYPIYFCKNSWSRYFVNM